MYAVCGTFLFCSISNYAGCPWARIGCNFQLIKRALNCSRYLHIRNSFTLQISGTHVSPNHWTCPATKPMAHAFLWSKRVCSCFSWSRDGPCFRGALGVRCACLFVLMTHHNFSFLPHTLPTIRISHAIILHEQPKYYTWKSLSSSLLRTNDLLLFVCEFCYFSSS